MLPPTPRRLLLLLSIAASAVCIAASSVGHVTWRLPLGIAPNEYTGALAAAADATTLYTSDSRGAIFAVEANSGRVRWSIPGSASLDQIFIFPSIPELLYYTAWDLAVEEELTLRAVMRSDGSEVARLRNLSTGDFSENPYAKVVSTDYGLAILHDFGLYSTDRYLNVQWKYDNLGVFNGQSGWYFSHLATSGSLVATIQRQAVTEPVANVVSFNVKTGEVVCNVSNVSATLLWAVLHVPFVLTEDSWSFLDSTMAVGPNAAVIMPRAVDLQRCAVRRTKDISSAADWAATIIPRSNVSDPQQRTLFFAMSLQERNSSNGLLVEWVVAHSEIGSNDIMWNMTFPASQQPPLVSKANGIEDAVLLWYLGALSAIDTATGAVRWSLAPTTVPTSPPFSLMDPQTVFPLGDGGRLFIPNLMGYTIVDTYSGNVLEVNFAEPILATLQFRDPTTGAGYVVFVNVHGEAVGASAT